jgi:tetratricopeptide (TPR) repeat protein
MKKLIAGLAATLLLSFAAVAADDIDGAYTELKTALDAKKGAAEIKPLAIAVLTFAAKTPDDAHAKEIAQQAEYGLLTTALASSPAEEVDLMGALEAGSPKSEYLASSYPHYLASLAKVAPAKVGPVVDKALTNFPDNQDLLVAAANNALQRQQADRALAMARRAIAAHPKKPEGISQGDWDHGQATVAGNMHWIAGVVQGSKNQFFECDKELKAALPLIAGNQPLLGTAYFYLGVCNYQLGSQIVNKAQVLEGQKYSEMSAAIPGPNQRQAYANVQSIKAAAAKMR